MNMLAEIVGNIDWAYAPAFYEPEYHADGTMAAVNRTRADVPMEITSCTINKDFDSYPLADEAGGAVCPTPHDRIAIEIMRGCPWQCRFCQSPSSSGRLRAQRREPSSQRPWKATATPAPTKSACFSFRTSDYPYFEELVKRMHEVFIPLGVNVSLPSLRDQPSIALVPKLMQGVRKSGLTLAPEVARDDMREQIRKKIKNDDLFEGCREAFKNGWQRVKLYFLCGLPGEREVDLDGIVDMAETICQIGKEVTGRYREVTASRCRTSCRSRTRRISGTACRLATTSAGPATTCTGGRRIAAVKVKQHDVETSLLEGILTRGDRRVAPALYEAWKRGARMDGWKECFNPDLWWSVFPDLNIDVGFYSHRQRPIGERLPWDHVNVKKGRAYLEKEQDRSVIQLKVMAGAGKEPMGCG